MSTGTDHHVVMEEGDVGFWHQARRHPGRVAIVDESGLSLTAGQLLSICNKIANALIAAGLNRNDVVTTVLPSGVDLIAFMLAIRQIGLYLLPLNPRVSDNELKFLVQDSAPKLLVVADGHVRPGLREYIRSEVKTRVIWITHNLDVESRLSSFLDGMPDSPPSHRIAGNLLAYTSGTTGFPKAVLRELSRLSPEGAAKPLQEWVTTSFGISSGTPGAFLNACPMYFAGPMSFATYTLHFGRPLILMPMWNARLALSLIARHGVSDTFLVPFQLADLLRTYRSRRNEYDLGSLKVIIHAGAHCPPDLKDQALDCFGDIVYETYGSTEVAGTVATPADARRRKGTVGRPIPPHEVRILDEDGATCRPGQVGKIYMKMLPNMRFSYKGDPEATRACQRDDFASVGDVGFVDEEGYLFLCGRSSEVINCRGEKILPATVENAATQHPHVLDAVAFGEASANGDDVVCLAVTMSAADATVQEKAKELVSFLRKSLSGAALPQSVLVVDHVPREESGKIRRVGIGARIRSKALFEMSCQLSSS